LHPLLSLAVLVFVWEFKCAAFVLPLGVGHPARSAHLCFKIVGHWGPQFPADPFPEATSMRHAPCYDQDRPAVDPGARYPHSLTLPHQEEWLTGDDCSWDIHTPISDLYCLSVLPSLSLSLCQPPPNSSLASFSRPFPCGVGYFEETFSSLSRLPYQQHVLTFLLCPSGYRCAVYLWAHAQFDASFHQGGH
jgi:hypothetical protein